MQRRNMENSLRQTLILVRWCGGGENHIIFLFFKIWLKLMGIEFIIQILLFTILFNVAIVKSLAYLFSA